jgi:hypothetical protein
VKTIREGSLYQITPNFPFDEDNKPPSDTKERNQLMKKGPMVELSTTPMNGSMV